MNKGLIVKSNDIITASYRLTANEHRLILCAISKIPKGVPVKSNTMYFVNSADFMEMGLDSNNASTYLREAAARIYDRDLVFNCRGLGQNRFRWLSQKAEIFDGKTYFNKFSTDKEREKAKKDLMDWFKVEQLVGNCFSEHLTVGIRFSEALIPYLSDLKDNFTEYFKEDIGSFSSAYSIRIYELLRQFKSTNYRVFKIDELRAILGLENKYSLMANFKQRVIDIAVSEINEKSPYNVTVEYVKKARSYTHIKFRFHPKNQKLVKKSVKQVTDERDPNTIDMFENRTDAENKIQSWELNGLTDKQIRKLAHNMKPFVEANNDKISTTDTRTYEQVFNSWKPFLKDPSTINEFKSVQEFLDINHQDNA